MTYASVWVHFDSYSNEVKVDWSTSFCGTDYWGWNDELGDHPIKVKYKKESELAWVDFKYSDGGAVGFPIEVFETGVSYKFKVKYYGTKRTDCRGSTSRRTLGTALYTIPKTPNYLDKPAIFNEIQDISKTKKIHGEYYDKCLYPYTWDGGSLASVKIFQWECWSNDPKAFIINDVIGGFPGLDVVTLKSQPLGYCIAPKGLLGLSSDIGVADCDSMSAIYIKEHVGGDMFRLKNALSGMCLYPTDSPDGAQIKQAICSENKDNQIFYFEDY